MTANRRQVMVRSGYKCGRCDIDTSLLMDTMKKQLMQLKLTSS
jgi:hypothetical protein